ncbi:MAG: bifunctional metallophosphatase/5'-nucleotidase [Myxococcales bacterium]|nr:bifunctional metallophosphatase/5'-nucleotidase [Myxococcales bacterium]
MTRLVWLRWMLRSCASLLLVAAFTGLSACTYHRSPDDLAGQDVRLVLVHTSDVHSRLLPYQYAPNTPDRALGLLALPGVCRSDGTCSTNLGRSCTQDLDCQAFSTASVGGLGRMATLVKRERQRAPRSLHLDSGDMFQGAPVFNLFNGETEVRAMGLLGVQGMALGNHEFDKGAVMLGLQLMNNGPNFPILAANYEWADADDQRAPKLGRFIHPVSIYNVKGVRIGVIGLGNVSSLNSSVEGDNSLGIRAREAKQAVSDLVRVVRPQVDLLVLLSHAGPDEDQVVAAEIADDAVEAQGMDTNLQMLGDVEGIDVILGGHLHVVYNPPVDLAHFDSDGNFIGHTIIVNSGAFAKFVGSLDMVVRMGDPDSLDPRLRRTFVKSYTYRAIPVTERPWREGDPEDPCDPLIRCDPPHPSNPPLACPWRGSGAPPKPRVVCIPPDPDMLRLLEPYEIRMKQLLNLNQVYAVVPCPTGSATCPKVLRNDPGGGDSQLGNLVATAMRLRRRVEADFGLTNALGIRADFESGPLTLEQLYNVFPFDNTITTQFLSGDEVLQMLDFVAERSSERGCRTQVQVSGIYFSVLCDNRPRSAWTVPRSCAQRLRATEAERQQWIGPHAYDIVFGDNCRRPDGSIDREQCRPVDCFASYKAAVNDFISVGGSGFVVLKRNTTRFNTGISLRDALADYIRSLPETDSRARCSATDPQWSNIKGIGQNGPFDYSSATCLTPEIQAHDGRIKPTVR